MSFDAGVANQIKKQPSADAKEKRMPKGVIGTLTFLGACMMLWFCWTTREVSRVDTWPTVDAVVSKCQTTSTREIHEGIQGNRVVWNAKFTFEFTYTVAGQEYTSALFYACGAPPREWVKREYPVGRQFAARYNPNNPLEAVVYAGEASRSSLVGAFVSWGIALSVTLYCLSRR